MMVEIHIGVIVFLIISVVMAVGYLEYHANKAEAKLKAVIDGLELQDTDNATPESLKLSCQVVALAAKKYDPMKALLKDKDND